jgi:hypothetical protein
MDNAIVHIKKKNPRDYTDMITLYQHNLGRVQRFVINESAPTHKAQKGNISLKRDFIQNSNT